jgi:hypothetical protein
MGKVKRASEFNFEYDYVQIDTELLELAVYFGLPEVPTGAFTKRPNLRYTDVWVTDSNAPYLSNCAYEQLSQFAPKKPVKMRYEIWRVSLRDGHTPTLDYNQIASCANLKLVHKAMNRLCKEIPLVRNWGKIQRWFLLQCPETATPEGCVSFAWRRLNAGGTEWFFVTTAGKFGDAPQFFVEHLTAWRLSRFE